MRAFVNLDTLSLAIRKPADRRVRIDVKAIGAGGGADQLGDLAPAAAIGRLFASRA